MASGTAARGIDFGIGEAIPYVLVEVPALGFGLLQLPIDLFGGRRRNGRSPRSQTPVPERRSDPGR
jgi:hypothetical protein